jgi:hypothetical protein
VNLGFCSNWHQNIRWRPAAGKERNVAASAAQWRGAITDGPYLETKELVGGFWVLEAADLDEALAWGR